MNLQNSRFPGLEWLNSTLFFFKTHFPMIIILGFIAGFGRVTQLKGFGPVSPTLFFTLEIVIEAARVALFLYILGSASMKLGVNRIGSFFTKRQLRKDFIQKAGFTLRSKWPGLLFSFLGYCLVALVINKLIDQLAYETCFYLSMQQHGVLSGNSSEWTVILFFKNLTVIPLTLVFNAMLVVYLKDQGGKMRAVN